MTSTTTFAPQSAVGAIPIRELLPWAIFAGLLLMLALYFVGAEEGATSMISAPRPPRSARRLRDCDCGTWRGRAYDDVVEREPEALAEWLRDPSSAPHGGETLQSLMQRVGEWLASENVPRRQTIVVTHASVIRAAIVKAIEAELPSFWRIDIAPLSVTRLTGDGSRWNLSEVSRP